jgi:hypothetical protein
MGPGAPNPATTASSDLGVSSWQRASRRPHLWLDGWLPTSPSARRSLDIATYDFRLAPDTRAIVDDLAKRCALVGQIRTWEWLVSAPSPDVPGRLL